MTPSEDQAQEEIRKANVAYDEAIRKANEAFEVADGINRKAYVAAVDKADAVHIAAHKKYHEQQGG